MQNPLVTIICTCYNQADYVFDALNSVINQSYAPLELIIVENGSKDRSKEVIQDWIWLHDYFKPAKVFFHPEPLGYCSAFNFALLSASGKYILDLSADDLLLTHHVENAVKALERSHAGAYFCNALLSFEDGSQRVFHEVGENEKVRVEVPEGDLYELLIMKYAICSATLVFRTKALKAMGGYDESLTYEDFDIMVRMARQHRFVFGDLVGIKKRILSQSFSSSQYKAKQSVMLPSTYKVCRKIQLMNRSAKEERALLERVMYECKHALASANFDVAGDFLELARELSANHLTFWLYVCWQRMKLDLSYWYEKWGKINFPR